jgi:hypothetical protein
VVLAAQVAPAVLLGAIAEAYEDRGHDLNEELWRRALNLVADERIRRVMPEEFPTDLRGWSIEELCRGKPLYPGECEDPTWRRQNCGDLKCQRAFVFAALHGPHDCKSTKDMRTIAEHCATAREVPVLFDRLRKRVISAMRQVRRTEAADVYLAT